MVVPIGQASSLFDLTRMDLQSAELLALHDMSDMLYTVQTMQLELTFRELYQGQVMWRGSPRMPRTPLNEVGR